MSLFDCHRFRCLKKRKVQPEDPSIFKIIPEDYPSISKEIPEEFISTHEEYLPTETQRIQPILTVSEVVSSIKEALEHLGNTLTSIVRPIEEKH